jgi:hypothetical protein
MKYTVKYTGGSGVDGMVKSTYAEFCTQGTLTLPGTCHLIRGLNTATGMNLEAAVQLWDF